MDNPAPGFAERPDHKIMLDTGPDPVTVMLDGEIVAMTTMAVMLREDGHPARPYVPHADVTATLTPTDKTTHCPFKGDTVYYDVTAGGTTRPASAWSYEAPYDEMTAIAGHVAFDEGFEVKVG
ncbi:DUF427 domain-containing protein [Acuticoccus sp.]|uniref:DUF427 domain-containing protein n=1 Tax=Acuticoccus sp. TaxID=1904378 RepID=UPI003B52D134